MAETAVSLQFDNNAAASLLFGEHDQNLARLEQRLPVKCESRGNVIRVTGSADAVGEAERALKQLYAHALAGEHLTIATVDAAARLAQNPHAEEAAHSDLAIATQKKLIRPRSKGQARYLAALEKHELVFGLGPAGTGKTYLAVACAVRAMMNRSVDRLILTRPAVEAGERLGFLPGDMKEKVDPFLRPIYDALYDMMPGEQVNKRLETGQIEIAPIAFMRGRTLSNAFVIVDEAQNTTSLQMKMLLTRIGEGSRMVVNGDISQTDLPSGIRSGLAEAVDLLADVKGIGISRFSREDVVRHELVARIVAAYEDAPKGL